jgi:hypothetical protein
MKEKAKEALWTERLSAWMASGESMRGFALTHGWPPRQLAYWKKRIADEAAKQPSLIPVAVKRAESADAIKLAARGWSLELPPSTPATWLAELLRAL